MILKKKINGIVNKRRAPLTLILDSTKFAMPKTKTSKLKITIPEDLNYDGIFDDILNKYTIYFIIFYIL